MKMWLDDIRIPPIDFDIWVKNATDAINEIKKGTITHISFDHDLGLDSLTGYDVACYIEENVFNGKIDPISWSIHSANPVGRKNITMAMESCERFVVNHF